MGGWGWPYSPFFQQGMLGKGGLKNRRYQCSTFTVVSTAGGGLPGLGPSPSRLAAE